MTSCDGVVDRTTSETSSLLGFPFTDQPAVSAAPRFDRERFQSDDTRVLMTRVLIPVSSLVLLRSARR